MTRTGGAGTSRGDRLAKWLAARRTPLAFVASAFGCSLMIDPPAHQCSSDRQCAALVENGQEARCAAGYCKLLAGGSSVGGAAGTANAGRPGGRAGEAGAGDTKDGNAGSSGSGSFSGAAGTNTEAGGESEGTGGSAAGASAGMGAGGGSSAAGGLAAGGSLGGTVGNTAGGTEGTAGAPASMGGSEGTGGSFGGSGGSANSGGNGASGGGTGGANGSTTANGVMVLTVPLTALGEGQRYNSQNTTIVAPYDLAGATLTLRAYAPSATGGNLHIYCTSGNFVDSTPTDFALSRLADGFQNVDIPVPQSATGGFQPNNIIVIRVEVEAGPGFGTSWRVPATVVYVDSITSSNGVIADTFGAAPTASTFGLSGTRLVPNSTLAWSPSTPPP